MNKKNIILISAGLVLLGIAGLVVAFKFFTDAPVIEKEKTVDAVDVEHEIIPPANA